jgi:hypothetical protein
MTKSVPCTADFNLSAYWISGCGAAIHSGESGSGFGEAHIGEDEAVALKDLTVFDGDRFAKHGACVDDGVELAVFTAGIDARGKIAEEIEVEVAAGKFAGKLLRIDADDAGAEAGGDHVAGETVGVETPDGKNGGEAGAGELLFAIAADVFEEEVAKGDGFNAVSDGGGAGAAHGGFILVVGAGPGKRYGMERKAGGAGLSFEQGAAGAVHGDAIEGGVEGGEEAGDVVLAALAEATEGPRTVFAAAPGEKKATGHSWSLSAEGVNGC